MSAARGTFWPMRKFVARNNKKFNKIYEKNHQKCGNQTKYLRNCLNNAIYGNSSN